VGDPQLRRVTDEAKIEIILKRSIYTLLPQYTTSSVFPTPSKQTSKSISKQTPNLPDPQLPSTPRDFGNSYAIINQNCESRIVSYHERVPSHSTGAHCKMSIKCLSTVCSVSVKCLIGARSMSVRCLFGVPATLGRFAPLASLARLMTFSGWGGVYMPFALFSRASLITK
jgi:hypothetical protein